MADFFDLIPKNISNVSETINEQLNWKKQNSQVSLTSELQEPLQLQVYSFSGQLLLQDEFLESMSFSLNQLDSDLVILSVKKTNGTLVFSRVVNK